jgi:hypothetical protein
LEKYVESNHEVEAINVPALVVLREPHPTVLRPAHEQLELGKIMKIREY